MRAIVAFTMLIWLAPAAPGTVAATATGRDEPRDTSLDWPQWRGVHRDGVSPETGLLERWREEGPRVVWRAEVGEGYSSVSVSGGKLYTLWDQGGRQSLVSLDAVTGKELWRRELGAAFKNHYGNGPRSTPLVADGVVYAVGTGGLLVATNQDTGALLWQHDLVEEFRAELPTYGYASSPLLVGNKLVIEAGVKDGTFMAFDRKSGKVLWRSANDRVAYSSPIAVTIDGVEQVVFWSAHGLHAVSPADGAVLWNYSWETFCPVTGDPLNTGTPVFLPPDRIFISSGSGSAVVRIRRAKEQKNFEVDVMWKSDEMRSDVNTAVLLGNYLYGFDRGTLKCLDARTGEVQWKARGFQRGSLIAAEGKLIVLGENGDLALVEANPTGFVERSKVKVLEGRNWTAPSLAQGRLYLRNHDELVCLDVKN